MANVDAMPTVYDPAAKPRTGAVITQVPFAGTLPLFELMPEDPEVKLPPQPLVGGPLSPKFAAKGTPVIPNWVSATLLGLVTVIVMVALSVVRPEDGLMTIESVGGAR